MDYNFTRESRSRRSQQGQEQDRQNNRQHTSERRHRNRTDNVIHYTGVGRYDDSESRHTSNEHQASLRSWDSGNRDQEDLSARRRTLDERVDSWRSSIGEKATSSSLGAGVASGVASGSGSFTFPNPNMMAPSNVESHYSGRSWPSRHSTPLSSISHSHRQGYIGHPTTLELHPQGWVPPERRVERERASQIIVEEPSRRRRRDRDRDRQRYE